MYSIINTRLMQLGIASTIILSYPLQADIVQLDTTSGIDQDRLGELSRTLSQGSFQHPDDMDIPQSKQLDIVINRTTKGEEENKDNNSMTIVLPEDYAQLKIKPLYPDSNIMYSKESNTYYEVNEFSNNIMMIYNLDENSVVILDNDNKESLKNSWKVACSKDRITDEKSCFLSKFALGVSKSTKYGLMLTVSDTPTKLNPRYFHYIRIDKNQAHKTKGIFNGQQAQAIVNQMKNGELAYTRFTEWDNKEYEETLSLWGFSVAYDVMNKLYTRLK